MLGNGGAGPIYNRSLFDESLAAPCRVELDREVAGSSTPVVLTVGILIGNNGGGRRSCEEGVQLFKVGHGLVASSISYAQRSAVPSVVLATTGVLYAAFGCTSSTVREHYPVHACRHVVGIDVVC